VSAATGVSATGGGEPVLRATRIASGVPLRSSLLVGVQFGLEPLGVLGGVAVLAARRLEPDFILQIVQMGTISAGVILHEQAA